MRRALLVLPVSFLLLTPAFANAADPPARVGRLSYVDGTVSFHPPGQQGDWSPATVNYPVTTGESFWTDANARAAIEVGPAELRLDQATELDITRLDDRSTDLQLDQGVLNIHLAQMPPGEISISTPRGRVQITAPGDYDIDAGQPDNDQPSDQVAVSVFDGAATFQGDRGSIDIPSGQAAVISGDPVNVQLVAASPNDFDQWAQDQEHRADLAKLPKAVPPAVTGYQDLAAYGSWGDDPDYGQVWYPSDVPADWAPYRYGHWAWVDPWGWTWIDDAPWGFAPFHYGRWIDRDDRWAWVPDDIPPQPVYAPALVSFVGGDGWGVDLAAGAAVAAIGWVALAPHESYHPWYHASTTYARNVNGRDWNQRSYNNAANVTLNNFHNRQAATVVPTAAFTHAAPVQRTTVAIAADQLARTRASSAAVTRLQPSAFARVGRADPQAAAAVAPRANAQANVARGRVNATTPEALAQQKPPTAPAPHRIAEAARPTRANAPANAAAAPNGDREQRNAAAPNSQTRPGTPNVTAGTNPDASQRSEQPNAARGPAPSEQRAERPNERQVPGANANLAPHPAPPNQPPREATRGTPPNGPAGRNPPEQRDLAQHPVPPNQGPRGAERGAPNAPNPQMGPEQRNLAQHPTPPNQPPREAERGAPNARMAPEQRNLAQHPTPPNQPPREAERSAPNAPNARTAPEQRNLAQHPTPPQFATQPRGQRAAPEHAAPNAPPQAARAQPPQPGPGAPPPSRQSAALPHETAPPHASNPAAPGPRPEPQHNAPPGRAAAPAQAAPHAPPQVAHAPAPPPPHAAPPAAPASQAAPHPAAAPAPHPPAAPAPHPAPAPQAAPHPAAAPAPHPPAAPQPAAPPPHAAPAPAPHPAAAPAPQPHPAPAPAAKAPPQQGKQPDKKDQPH